MLKIDKALSKTIGKNTATELGYRAHHRHGEGARSRNGRRGRRNESQANYLLAHHVEFAQGWLFSHPLPAKEFIEFYYRTNSRTQNVRAIYQGAA